MSNRPIIKVLAGENIKGATFRHILDAITVFFGKNFKGKSSRIDTLQIALLGYQPALGKKNSEVFKLASGRSMSCSVEVVGPEPFSVGRVFTAKAGGTVSMKTDGEIPAKLAKCLGLMMNPNEYFGLSEKARMDYVFGLMSDSGFDAKKIWNEIRQDARTLAVDGDAKVVGDAITRIISLIDLRGGQGIAEGLADLVVTLKSEVSSLKAAIERMAGTVAGVTEIRMIQEQLAGLGISDEAALTTRLATIADSRRAVAGRLGALAQKRDSIARNAKQRESLEFALAGDVATFTTEQSVKLAELITRKQAVFPEFEKAKTEVADCLKFLTQWGIDCMTLAREIEVQEKKVASLAAMKCCPTCGNDGDSWKIRYIDEQRQVLLDQQSLLVEQKSNQENYRITLEGVCANRDRVQGEYNTLSSQIIELQKQEAAATQAVALRSRSQAALDAIPVEYDPDPDEEAGLRAEDAVLEADHNSLSYKLAQARDLKSKIQTIADAESRFKNSETQHKVFKLLLSKVDDRRTALVAQAFDIILVPANKLWAGVMDSALVYREGEIGYESDTGFVSYKTFSGTEQALCYMAIGVGLAAQSGIRICLLDEMMRLDCDSQQRLMTAMKSCINDGTVDQFIGVTTNVTHLIAPPEEISPTFIEI